MLPFIDPFVEEQISFLVAMLLYNYRLLRLCESCAVTGVSSRNVQERLQTLDLTAFSVEK